MNSLFPSLSPSRLAPMSAWRIAAPAVGVANDSTVSRIGAEPAALPQFGKGLQIQAGNSIGVQICSAADQALIEAAADGVLFVLTVESYKLKDVTNASVATANLLLSNISTVSVYKVDGKVIYNSANVGHFNPDVVRVQATSNVAGLSELFVSTVH